LRIKNIVCAGISLLILFFLYLLLGSLFCFSCTLPLISPSSFTFPHPLHSAVPDGMIVLFSGMGPNAQEQLNVGVGALAGSTVMLITVPWLLSVYAGRVDIEVGVVLLAVGSQNKNRAIKRGVLEQATRLNERRLWHESTSLKHFCLLSLRCAQDGKCKYTKKGKLAQGAVTGVQSSPGVKKGG
jgi:hypothetical protein